MGKHRHKKHRQKGPGAQESLREQYDFCDETFSFIAGYTSGGAPYGTTWEEVGIDPALSFEEKVALLSQLDTPPVDIAEEEREWKNRFQRLKARVLKGGFSRYLLSEEVLPPSGRPWFCMEGTDGEESFLICRPKDVPEEASDYLDDMAPGQLRVLCIEGTPETGTMEIMNYVGGLLPDFMSPTVVSSGFNVYYIFDYEELNIAVQELVDAGITVTGYRPKSMY